VLAVRSLNDEDRPWAVRVETESWGTPVVARLGELVDPTGLPGFVAVLDGRRAGLLTYAVRGDECEVVTIRSLREGRGVGRALLDAVRDAATDAGCVRLWLVTTNNNVRAFALYQRWGMEIVAFHRNAVSAARRLKPSIPERDANGVRIAHEFEFELLLRPRG
jgi:ribosomal protein S18 acetylase RimI-like enzyme